eukprot:9484135-Pyramimonas_sp.AAC.1
MANGGLNDRWAWSIVQVPPWWRSFLGLLRTIPQSSPGIRSPPPPTTSTKTPQRKHSATCSGRWTPPRGHVPNDRWRPWELEPGGQQVQIVTWNASALLCRDATRRRKKVSKLIAHMKHRAIICLQEVHGTHAALTNYIH